MAYFIDLFTPETYQAFTNSDRDVSGFRPRQQGMADRVKPGDFFICYLTRLSRWCGVLQVKDGPFTDEKPIFVPENDPFVIRFHVQSLILLEYEKAIPIHDSDIWHGLSFTRDLHVGSLAWTGMVRSSLVRLDDSDGRFLAEKLRLQTNPETASTFPLHENERRKLATHTVTTRDKVIAVSVPDDPTPVVTTSVPIEVEVRESIGIQALIAKIGSSMGMSIWLPRSDRHLVLREWSPDPGILLEKLPLNYDDTTLRTIEQIDVLWLNRRSIVRAFEVEHTTSVYSGILRMADLLALQPNMQIKLHIVAPVARREKVFSEIRRPVFSLLEKGPLADTCTYLPYESVRTLAAAQHLPHLSDSVLDEYAEEAE